MSSVGPIRGLLLVSVKGVQQGLTMTDTNSDTTIKLLAQALVMALTLVLAANQDQDVVTKCRYKLETVGGSSCTSKTLQRRMFDGCSAHPSKHATLLYVLGVSITNTLPGVFLSEIAHCVV